ncbi:MAG: hypothetical protein K2Q28_06540 [Hyphomicrobium sp.]|nr:hypothetical protein [Hyphomicrobium sp.]
MVRVLFALVAAAGVAGNAVADGGAKVEPLTLLENGKIAGCGMMSSSARVIGEVIAFRQGTDTSFAIRARPVSGSSAVTSVRFTTASHDSASLFPASTPIGDGIVETRAVLQGFTGPSFAQELMVMGGRFEIATVDGHTISYDLPRPMPHRVRQAYLNCAGDLFRPEDE